MPSRRKGKRITTPDGVRVLGKNANREGSVYRQANGRWCATWWELGRPRPRVATGKNREAAIARRAQRQKEAGLVLNELRTIGALADWWLHTVYKQRVRPSSWAKAANRVRRIKTTLSHLPVTALDYRLVTEWQASLLAVPLAPRTVRHHRQTLALIIDEAVKLGMIAGNPVRSVDPPHVPDYDGVALTRDQSHALLDAAREHRLGAAVALLFLQGWRVSEVLGLAWDDIDLETGTVTVRRASVYVDGHGQQLGLTKTDGARGEQWLMPTVVELLKATRELQATEGAAAPRWDRITYEGVEIHLVFTTPAGGLVLRQTVAKVVKQAARTAGITADLATHTGRRSVVTSLYSEGEEALEDIARFVGHARSSTTAGYVKRLGRRPKAVADRAAALLDPAAPAAGSGDVDGDEIPGL
jgi:integrase